MIKIVSQPKNCFSVPFRFAGPAWSGTKLNLPSIALRALHFFQSLTFHSRRATQQYFDVTGHSTPDSRPVGSINRACWRADAASKEARLRQ